MRRKKPTFLSYIKHSAESIRKKKNTQPRNIKWFLLLSIIRKAAESGKKNKVYGAPEN